LIPFLDLKSQYASIKSEIDAAIQGVLNSCQFTLGDEVAEKPIRFRGSRRRESDSAVLPACAICQFATRFAIEATGSFIETVYHNPSNTHGRLNACIPRLLVPCFINHFSGARSARYN
jgi:hypothetical protein